MLQIEKIRKSFSVFITCLLFSSLAVAANSDILLVSDIDDTLKISHVLSTWDSFTNSGKIGNHFRGMSEALNLIKNDQGNKVKFAYVSNAPKSIMNSNHTKFIAQNKFPTGALFTRDKLSSETHKVVTIQKLIDENKPLYVILIGDNGENDPRFYEAIVKSNPGVQFLTIIHQVYSSKAGAKDQGSPLYPGQLSYVTSVEVAEIFLETNLISNRSFDGFARNVIPAILKDKLTLKAGTIAFPKWMDCSDSIGFINAWATPPDVTKLVDQYYSLRAQRCSP